MRLAARKRGSSRPSARGVGATPAHVLRTGGRVALWCLVALLLLRGAADVMAGPQPAPVVREARAVVASWPDDGARAFALGFTRAYLTFSPKRPDSYSREVARFASPELISSLVPVFAERESPQVVLDATVARVAPIDDAHALVTVAATISAGKVSTRFVTVPVARGARGGLVVFDLPSFSPPPALGQAAAPELEPLTGSERAGIEAVLSRFFRAFLSGDAEQLEYLVPADGRIGALSEPHELVAVSSVAQLGGTGGSARTVLATVRARDLGTGVVYALRYRLRLVLKDRWYVAAVDQSTSSKG